MAAITKNGKVSLATPLPDYAHKYSGDYAGEAIVAGDACYLKSDGKIWKSTAVAANAAAVVDGFALVDAAVGQPVTIAWEVTLAYGTGLSVGTFLYLSAAVAGGLDTVAGANQLVPVARVRSDGGRLLVMRTY